MEVIILTIKLSDLIGGAGGTSKYIEVIALVESQSWSPDRNVLADVVAVGAGGSGAAISVFSSANRPTGGAAGGFCKVSDVTLLAATSYTATVGAGGDKIAGNSVAATPGNNGGNTSFTDGGSINLIANGGDGGVIIPTMSGTLANGGTASGGDINLTGGDSGGETSGASFVTGGANVDVGFGKSRNTTSTIGSIGTNGRGLFGDDKTTEVVLGAGAGGFLTGYGPAFIPNLDFLGIIKNTEPALPYSSNVQDAYTIVFDKPDIGVGGCSMVASGSFNLDAVAQSGGMFAGGGNAYASISTTPRNIFGGDGGVGAGGGSAVGNVSAAYVYSGRGGDGIIFIAIKENL